MMISKNAIIINNLQVRHYKHGGEMEQRAKQSRLMHGDEIASPTDGTQPARNDKFLKLKGRHRRSGQRRGNPQSH